jgi:hypothetical protein
VRQYFVARMHGNALCDPQIPLDAKQKVGIMCPDMLFVEFILAHRSSRMHYAKRRSNRMYKHKFDVTCPDAFYGNRTRLTEA